MAGLIAVCVAFITTLFLNSATYAAPGINQTLSFQGRLLTSAGGVVADGYYNMQFKIYEGGTASGGGTEKWSESYTNNNANAGVNVKNGYFSVTLGSKTAFASLVNWNDDTLYLSMNIAGNSPSCTTFASCSPDGEMTPMKRITSVPFAINSAQLGGRTADGFIQNGTSPQTADFNIVGTGTATSLRASSLDTASAGTLTLGGTNATSITMADEVTVAAGKSLTLAGGNTASRPASPSEGTLYFDTATKQLLVYANGKWKSDSSSATKIIAASDSSQSTKDTADYVADGEDSSGSGIGTLDGDQIQINAAISAVSAQGGGTVYLSEGTYTIDGAIRPQSNVILSGSGAATIVRLGNFGSSSVNINAIDIDERDNVTVRDLTLDGRRTTNTNGTHTGVRVGSYNAPHATIEGIYANNFRSNGVFVQSSGYNKVISSHFDNNGTGIAFRSDGMRYGIISDNIVTNSVASGIDLSQVEHITVSNNISNYNGIAGIGIEADSVTMSSNVTNFNGETGIEVYSGASNIIQNNTSHYNQRGLRLTSTSDAMVTNNSLSNNTATGITVTATSDSTVKDNTIRDSAGTSHNNAIFIDSNSDGNTISGNSIADSSATASNYAIVIYDNQANNNIIANNALINGTISDAGTGTIYSNQLDASGKIINKSSAGTTVQTGTNNATAFQVQDAAGTSALTVNTSNNSVLVAGTLDTTTATTLSIGNTTATAISLGSTSGNILTTMNGSALVKSTAGNDSTTAFQVQNAAATTLFTADTANMQVVIGNSGDTITLSSSGISFAGNARGTKQIRLAAEYQNTVLDTGATGNNSGTMLSSLDLTSRMNFYRWSASPATSQTYDIVTQVPIPQDFSAWAASNPLSITSRTNHTTDGVITLELRDSSGTERCSFTSLTMGSANSWITNTPNCLSSGTYTPGDYLTMRLRMSSKNNAQVDVGNIVLNYLSNK